MWVLCYILGWPTRRLLTRYQHSLRYVVYVSPICANLCIPRSIACTYTRSWNVHSRKERDIHTYTCLQINEHTSTQYIHNRKAPCNMIYMRIHAHATYCIECSYARFTRRARTDSRCGRSGTPRHLFYMYTYRGRCRSCRESSTWTHQGREVCVCVWFVGCALLCTFAQEGWSRQEQQTKRRARYVMQMRKRNAYPHLQHGTHMHTHTQKHIHTRMHMHAPVHAYRHTCCCIHIERVKTHTDTQTWRAQERARALTHTCTHACRDTHMHARAAAAYIYRTCHQNTHRHTDMETTRKITRASTRMHTYTHVQVHTCTHAHRNTHARKHTCCWIHVSSASTHTHARTHTQAGMESTHASRQQHKHT
jgi:hypothetical protein